MQAVTETQENGKRGHRYSQEQPQWTLPLLLMCNGVGLDITDEEQVAAFIAELKDYNPYLNRTTDHDRHIRDNGK